MLGVAQLPPVEQLNPPAVNSLQFAGFRIAINVIDDPAYDEMLFAAARFGCGPLAQEQFARVNSVHAQWFAATAASDLSKISAAN